MVKVSLAEAQGYKLTQDPLFPVLTRVDPYERLAVVDYGTSAGMATWDGIKMKYNVEIVLTPEEVEMVERGRLTKKVEEKAKLLGDAITAWLLKEKAR